MPVVHSGGQPIHYEVFGTGPTIVLVHGFASSLERNWGQSGWIDFLVAEGRRVVGLDCRGHGGSGKPHDPDAYSGTRMLDDVIAVMDAVAPDAVDLMGYSMGGSIAFGLLSRYPERFSSVVVGGQGLGPPADDPHRSAAIADALETDDPSTVSDPGALRLRQFAENRQTHPRSLTGTDNDLKALAAIWRSDRADGNLLRFVGPDYESSLRRVPVPLLAVVGEKDLSLRSAQSLVEMMPRAELLILQGEDHLSAVRAQGYKRAVSTFIRKAPPVSSTAVDPMPGS